MVTIVCLKNADLSCGALQALYKNANIKCVGATAGGRIMVRSYVGALLAAFLSLNCTNAVSEEKLTVGQNFRDCPGCPEMVLVPAGSFTMGSPESEPARDDNEGPQHKVTIAEPFAVGRFAVTFVEWDACVADGGCGGYSPDDKGWGRGDRPVINVSWQDAKVYVAWLSKKTGKDYRLLSEAEREYVTRAGTITPFWWGGSITTDQANYVPREPYEKGRTKGEFRRKTVPVKSFDPNPWGLYQVHGNILEWVEDCQHDSYAGAPTDGLARTTVDCQYRVLRGGSWNGVPWILRAAYRIEGAPDLRNSYVGFRVARRVTS
jgi:formylglycine-generating enzyme required for sulfatase activity